MIRLARLPRVRRLRRRVLCAAMATVPLLTSGCGPSVPPQLGIKNVPLDIAVGNDTAVEPPHPGAAAPPVAQALPAFAPVITTVSPKSSPAPGFVPPAFAVTPAETCPALDSTKASPAPASPEVEGPATAGTWPFGSSGSYVVNGAAIPLPPQNVRVVSNPAQTSQGVFTYAEDGITFGFPNAPAAFRASNSTSAPANPLVAPTSAFGLTQLDIPTTAGIVMFHPQTPLTLLSTPAQAYGAYNPDPNNPAIPNTTGSWSDAQSDAQHGTSVSIQATNLGQVRVNACGTPVDAWQVQATLTITSTEVWLQIPTPAKTELTLTVSYAVATGLGGMIVDEKVQTAPNPDSSPDLLAGATFSTKVTSTISSPRPEAAR
jgi:hypothetical protein